MFQIFAKLTSMTCVFFYFALTKTDVHIQNGGRHQLFNLFPPQPLSHRTTLLLLIVALILVPRQKHFVETLHGNVKGLYKVILAGVVGVASFFNAREL